MVFWPCDFETNAEEAKFVHTRPFLRFLEERFNGEANMIHAFGEISDARARLLHRWRCESRTDSLVDIGRIDEVLLDLFRGAVMINDLPVDCFSFRSYPRRSPTKSNRISRKKRREIVLRVVENGEAPKSLALEIDRTTDLVQKWVREYRREVAA